MMLEGKPVTERPKWFDNLLLNENLRRRLLNFARGKTKDLDRSEDLLSQTTLKALESWYQHYECNHFNSWMFAIMRNTHIDNLRRPGNVVLEHALEPWEDEEYRVSNLEYVLPNQIDALSLMEIGKIIEDMPHELREVLIAEAVEGRTLKEIAEEAGVEVGVIRERLAQAREQLGDISDYVSENGSFS